MSPYIIPGLPTKVASDYAIAEHITICVCNYLHIPRKLLNVKTRKTMIVMCRYIAMYFIKKETALSFQSIAEIFAPATTNHTTAIYGINQIKDQLSLPVMNRRKQIVEDIINKNLLSYD